MVRGFLNWLFLPENNSSTDSTDSKADMYDMSFVNDVNPSNEKSSTDDTNLQNTAEYFDVYGISDADIDKDPDRYLDIIFDEFIRRSMDQQDIFPKEDVLNLVGIHEKENKRYRKQLETETNAEYIEKLKNLIASNNIAIANIYQQASKM